MKAAILNEFGSPLAIENIPEPSIGTGEVIVDVAATGIVPYSNEVFSGEREYLLDLPIVPGNGAVGRVREVGPDATRLQVGDWVFCDPTVRSRDNALTPDITLQAMSARGEGGLQLQEYFHHGAFAEQMRVPTENAIPIGPIDPDDAGKWCALSILLVPYGGLLAGDLQAGETIVISGSTGNFGSAAVAVALAMGAGCVVAPGRNEAMLDELSHRFGGRVRPVKLTEDEENDREAIKAAAPGPVDCVLDLLPPQAGPTQVRAAAMTVREFGRVIFMGGVGWFGEELGLSYRWIMRNSITIRGQWMYPRKANPQIINLVRSGLLDLDDFKTTSFDLDQANKAVDYAAEEGGRFKLTVIRP